MDTTSNTSDFKPALMSVADACLYLGGVSRAKFYADLLPILDTVKLGARRLIVVASIDRLIAEHSHKE